MYVAPSPPLAEGGYGPAAFADLLADRALHIGLVRDALVSAYGERAPHKALDPLSELIATILSQHTSDINSGRAFASLRQRFSTWADVLAAPTGEVAEVIRAGGLANQKAPRIQAILHEVLAQQGRLSLDNLADEGLSAATARLRALHGVGPKTAACVLLFACHLPAFPVDTHVHRVSRRLGFAPASATPEDVQRIVEGVLPPEQTYDLHVNLISHGRQVCKAQRPHCPACSLRPLCLYGQTQRR